MAEPGASAKRVALFLPNLASGGDARRPGVDHDDKLGTPMREWRTCLDEYLADQYAGHPDEVPSPSG